LFRAIAWFENFDLAPQDYREAKIALAGFINQFAAFQDAPPCQWLEQRKLVIVQFGKRDAFRVAIKLFVLLLVRRHFPHFTRCNVRSKREDSRSRLELS